MVADKRSTRIILAVMAAAVVLCLLAVGYSEKLTGLLGGTSVRMEYESELFNTDEPIVIDIQMDEDDWNKMLSNATSEEYYVCDVVVNGKKIRNTAIRPKGNTSLSAIAMDEDSNRFSFKLEFDHFVEGQTCYGLDKLILNNNYADATNMKEAIIYDMYQYLGADASLYNYAEIYVNGEYWGVYLALEGVEESFMLRNYGTQDGELYKPDSMNMGGRDDDSSGGPSKPDMDFSGMDFSNMDFSQFERPDSGGMTPPENGGEFTPPENRPENGSEEGSEDGQTEGSFSFDSENRPDPGNMDFPGGGGFSMGGGGANLNYTDDELDSYSTIWEGEVTGTGKSDHRRVVTALKNISEGNDLEKYLDVDNVLKYMAVHTFAVNMDSLSGSMAHNYYLYEYNGQLNILPWDYNLSFGGMSMGNSGSASDVINDAIDTPFSGTHFFDALLENEEYLERYHEYLRQLVEEYVNGGRFDEVYERIRTQIDPLVEKDPNSSYTYEEYLDAADMLYRTIKLRAESIEGQLNGTIPSTDEGQRQDSSALIDASSIDIDVMGKFSMGNDSDDGFIGLIRPGSGRRPGSSESSDSNTEGSGSDSTEQPEGFSPVPEGFDPNNMPEGFSMDNMPEGFDRENMPEGFGPGSMPEGFSTENMPEGFDKENMPEGFDSGNMPEGSDPGSMPDMSESGTDSKPDMGSFSAPGSDGDSSFTPGDSMPSFSGMPGQTSAGTTMKNLVTFGVCFVIMAAALIAAVCYKRRK